MKRLFLLTLLFVLLLSACQSANTPASSDTPHLTLDTPHLTPSPTPRESRCHPCPAENPDISAYQFQDAS